MPLLRVYEDDQYWPDYSTFCVRDVPEPGRVGPGGGELLAQYAVDAVPCGSVARAGAGWVDGAASSDHRHAVRIEAHDTAPDVGDLSEWDEVLETPFLSSGMVRLEMVVGGSTGGQIEIGPPGAYRLRFARRPVVAGDNPDGSRCEYRLWFWPVDAPAEPPRWLRRTGPLLDERAGAPSEGGVRRAVSDVVMLALWAAESATPVTLAWLADRLSTTTAAVRRIVEHPRTSGVLSLDGNLDDADSPLTATVHAKRPRTFTAAAGQLPTVAPKAPGSARTAVGRPATAARAGVAGRPKMAARPAVGRRAPAGEQGPTGRAASGDQPGDGPDLDQPS